MTDLTQLPADLPVPEDDDTADRPARCLRRVQRRKAVADQLGPGLAPDGPGGGPRPGREGAGLHHRGLRPRCRHGEHLADERRQASLDGYFEKFTPEQLDQIQAVAMDLWEPFAASTRAHLPDAENKIVFDRYHLMGYLASTWPGSARATPHD